MYGKTITLYLPDGTPSGLRIIELTNWSGIGFAFPRISIDRLKGRDECQEIETAGVYLLIGPGETPEVYVGESENLLKRIKEHYKDQKKDYWETAIAFASKDANLTKSHILYLESRLIHLIKDSNIVKLMNEQSAMKDALPRSFRDAMDEFLAYLLLLLDTLGYQNLHRKVRREDSLEESAISSVTFCLKSQKKGVDAKMRIDEANGDYFILAGSRITIEERPSFKSDYKAAFALKNQLIANKKLIKSDDGLSYILHEDVSFSSPSYSAGFVLGRTVNGRTAWKTEDDKTLADIERLLAGEDDNG